MPPTALVKGKDAAGLKDYTQSGCDGQGQRCKPLLCRGSEMLGGLSFLNLPRYCCVVFVTIRRYHEEVSALHLS